MHNRIWNKFHLLEGCFLCLVQTTMPKPCEIQNALVAEVALQTHHIADSGGDPDTIYWIAIFKKVLGTRRGHVRDIEPKPSSATGTRASSQWQSQSQAPQATQLLVKYLKNLVDLLYC